MRLRFSRVAALLQAFDGTFLDGNPSTGPNALPAVVSRQRIPTQELGEKFVKFVDCPKSSGIPADSGLQCANFSVPLDWKNPKELTTLGMVRLPAKDPKQRIGSLFFNPGGPGIAASDVMVGVTRQRQNFSQVLRERFDIIGLDQRGAGLSSPVRCNLDAANAVPVRLELNQASFDDVLQTTKKLALSCREQTGPVFDQMDTITAARDIEAVRVAMGNESLNWLGQSYGSQLGAQYAALFPGNVRAMMLDGILQHSGSTTSQLFIEQTSAEMTMRKFFSVCGADPECPLYGKDPAAVWAKVVDEATAGKLKALGCDSTPKTGCLPDVPVDSVVGGARNMLFYQRTWNKQLARAIDEAGQGNASLFANSLFVTGEDEDSQIFAFNAIVCQDGIETTAQTLADYTQLSNLGRFATVPGFSEFWRTRTLCAGWTPTETNPKKTLNVTGTQNPVFLMNSYYDPATSLVWAEGVKEQIQGSVLAFRDGNGHTSYFIGNESKVAMDEYLVNLRLPAQGTVFPT